MHTACSEGHRLLINCSAAALAVDLVTSRLHSCGGRQEMWATVQRSGIERCVRCCKQAKPMYLGDSSWLLL